MKVIYLDRSIKTNFQGFNNLISLYYDILQQDDRDIEINFSKTQWFEANLCAVLGAITQNFQNKGYSIRLSQLNSILADIFLRNNFLEGSKYNTNTRTETVITFGSFLPNEDVKFNTYIIRELLSKINFPNHSPLLGKKIRESIFEVFENAYTHGLCSCINTCGQYYPNKTPAVLDMTIVDMGHTIHQNVCDFLPDRNFTAIEAIEWAIQYGNSTKRNCTGGLGLDLIINFIELNQGKIQIVSSDGYWECDKGVTKTDKMRYTFPGTIVNIEFNFEDTMSYSLKNEPAISIDNIF